MIGRIGRGVSSWNRGGGPMLVLSRKIGEKILIGDQISVTVVRIAPGVVRIGIDAPDNLNIVREELKTQDQVPAPTPAGSARISNVCGPPRPSNVP